MRSAKNIFLMKHGPLENVKDFIHPEQRDTYAAHAGMKRLEKEDPETHKAKKMDFVNSVRNHGSVSQVRDVVRKHYFDVDTALDIVCDPFKEGRTEPAWGNRTHENIHQLILERQPNLPGHVVRQFTHTDNSLFVKAAAIRHKNMPAEDIKKIANDTKAGMISGVAKTEAYKRGIDL